ncbi:MAG: GNAT family N-acetyltransferase [Saccharospirillaceae bacterium]|nr:GNAT family N-acetyltransferase [Pseudomonadales bacterium]NRB81258.1 GNAT family N-acetyltransferase [Saccharospirillaceae bacterium]
MGKISAPQVFNQVHEVNTFDCGELTLNEWLIKRVLKNQNHGASRTFVICELNKVVGYYALASGSIDRIGATKNIGRNMPDPIPVVVLARLAIDMSVQNKRLGKALLKDAILRTLNISEQIGVRALMVHCISPKAKVFYQQFGFQESPIDSMTLMLSIKQLKSVFLN